VELPERWKKKQKKKYEPSSGTSPTNLSLHSHCWSGRNEISTYFKRDRPKIGGVMIMGDRGTGKSTTVRALVDLLPDIQVVANDPLTPIQTIQN
jgi:Cdc6-like AAA superfamily ATPase